VLHTPGPDNGIRHTRHANRTTPPTDKLIQHRHINSSAASASDSRANSGSNSNSDSGGWSNSDAGRDSVGDSWRDSGGNSGRVAGDDSGGNSGRISGGDSGPDGGAGVGGTGTGAECWCRYRDKNTVAEHDQQQRSEFSPYSHMVIFTI